MIFENVKLIHFRNFEKSEFKFSKRVNIFIGNNGKGKTNILESLFLATQGQSFRYGKNDTFIQQGYPQSLIKLNLNNNNLDYLLTLEINKIKKSITLNEKNISSTEIKKKVSCIIFSPESLSIIKESSDQRRQIVDELLISHNKNNIELINNFKKILRNRNSLLKLIQENPNNNNNENLLEIINQQFLKSATDLTFERIQVLNCISNEFNNAMQYIPSDLSKEINTSYIVSEHEIMDYSWLEIEHLLKKRMQELKNAEKSSGISLVGPHKHEILFIYNGNNSRFFCSQGQQRAIILSFKIAQIVYHRKVHGVYPILMLDDVLSELDENKRKALISFLHEIKTQVFLTTTDLNLSNNFQLDGTNIIEL